MANEQSQRQVAIIGAGPAGLAAARALDHHGDEIRIFDKGRGPGGRLSTRRLGETRFDHGARALDFPVGRATDVLERWTADQAAAPWNPRVRGGAEPHEHQVGTPAMNAVVKADARDLNVTFGTRIVALQPQETCWALIDQDGSITTLADRVVLAVPAPQAHDLLAPTGFAHLKEIAAVEFDPVWAFMFEGPDRIAIGFDALEHPSSVIAHAEAQSSKPGRRQDRSWVAHATVEWSRTHVEDERPVVEELLARELSRLLETELSPPWSAHRWRYGLVRTPVGREVLVDESRGLVACGDWCLGPTVEHALLSGRAAGRS